MTDLILTCAVFQSPDAYNRISGRDSFRKHFLKSNYEASLISGEI